MAEKHESESQNAPVSGEPVMGTTQKIKHDWYQTETHVVINILLKGADKDKVIIGYEENSLSVSVKLPNGSDYSLELDLAHEIVPKQCSHKVLSSKIEIKMKKSEDIRWQALEGDPKKTDAPQPIPQSILTSGPPKYPSSALKAKDWDRVVGDITKEEAEEKPEGEAALNALFQKIYSQGSDEVKRAMNKSFQESGGTVLSTNWNEVSKDHVDVKAPDGMEWKRWDS